MTKRWLAALVIGIAVVALAAYAAAGQTSTTKSLKSGGTFRIGTSSRIDSLNPYVAFNQDAYNTFEYIYPLLVQYDKASAKFIPDFATSWTTSNGGKTWTFKTRKGAKWTDGKPLTARDAAWSINTDIKYAGTGAANAAGLIAHIKNAKAPNATTLVVNYVQAPGNVARPVPAVRDPAAAHLERAHRKQRCRPEDVREQRPCCRSRAVQADEVQEGRHRAVPEEQLVLRREAEGRRVRTTDVLEL